jgi:hypothetical protein
MKLWVPKAINPSPEIPRRGDALIDIPLAAAGKELGTNRYFGHGDHLGSEFLSILAFD